MCILGGEKGACNLNQTLRAVLFPGIYGQEVVSLYLPLSLAAQGVPPSLGGIVQQVRPVP